MEPTADNEPTSSGSGKSNPFRVFKNREYALYFAGQFVSQVGSWMQQIALSWLTYKLTSSALLLALVGVSSQLPALLVMPFAGVLADRFNKHRIVVFAQVFAMIQASILAFLTISHQIQTWHLVVLGIMMGFVNAFDMPVRSAFVIEMVKKKEDLPAAIAMNSSLMNLSRLFGPALAGFVVAAFGEGECFLLNAISYVVVIVALMFIHGNFEPKKKAEKNSMLSELKDGFFYALNTSPIRATILLLAAFSFGGMAFMMLLPVYVKEIGGDANTLGYLSSASAFGSVIGTVILASKKSVIGMGRWIVISSFVYALALFAFGFVWNFWLALGILAVLGAAMMLQMGCCNTILQSVVDDDKRGRVMSLFTMAFMGMVPLGSIVAGALANQFGFQNMIFCSAIYCLVVATVFAALSPVLRREAKSIYIQRGLLEAEEEVEVLSKPVA